MNWNLEKWLKPTFTYHQTYHKEHTDSAELDFPLIKRLLTYLRPFRVWLIFSILLLLASKSIDAYVPIWIGSITQKILSMGEFSGEAEKNAVLESTLKGCFGIILLLTFSYFFDFLNVFLKSWIGQKTIFKMRTQVFEHIQSMPISFFDHHAVGRLMTRTIHDVDQIDQMFSESIVPIVGNFLLLGFIFLGILWVDWKIALLISLAFPLVWWLTQRFRNQQRICYDMVRAILSALNGFIQEHLMGASTIRLFGLQNKEKQKFEDINDDYRMANIESIHNFSFFFASIEFIHNLVLIAVFALLVIWISPAIGFQAGTFFTFSLYALMIFRPIGDLAERYNVLQSAIAAARRVFHILDQPNEKLDQGKIEFLDDITEIEFDHVSFAYEKENWVLKEVSFKIKAGQTVALVGMTGSGKTTILSLLLRFYQISQGSIKINGRDIRDYSLHALRSKFSVVLQDPVIFSGTITDNISLFDSKMTAEKIENAIDYVNLRSFVDRFPEGIHHTLSERGIGLSAGEMQLISLARAVAHAGEVLVLDEATANIDVGNERAIQSALQKILSHKTALVIAHRLSTVQRADLIIVMHQGKIQESGTHHELIQAKGVYEKLYRLQFQNDFTEV